MSEQSMTYEMIARLFRYDPETGMLHWCSRPEEDFPDERCQKAWNTKFSGKLAGYVNNQNNRRIVRIAVDGKGHNFLSYRTSFLEGVGRYENLFSKNQPSIVAQFSERVPMVKGRLTATGSTATSYCWLVWIKGAGSTKLVWIPPCRKKLERHEDYAAYREVAA